MFFGRRNARLAAAALAVGAFAGAAQGQATEQWSLSPAGGTASQRFGYAMVVKGDVMVVGAPYDDTQGTDAGATDVYRWDAATGTWKFEQLLFASDPEASARFGHSVAVDGNVLVVSAPLKDTANGTDGGQIYIFRYSTSSKTWSQEQKHIPSVGAGDNFGTSVAISGNVIVSGAPKSDTTKGTDSGSAFVHRYKNSIVKWVEEAQLIDSDGVASDNAGTAVALEGSTAVIGSPFSTEGSAYYCGSVAVWTVSGTTWTQGQEVLAPTPEYYSSFGSKLRFSGDALFVIVPSEDEGANYDAGAIHLFRLVSGTFTHEKRFVSPTPAYYGGFGSDAAVLDDLLVLGSQNEDVSGKTDAGAAYLYRKTNKDVWVFDHQLGASDSASSDRLGAQVAIAHGHILATADGNDLTAGSDWGNLYGFDQREIVMTIDPPNPAPAQSVTFSAFRGNPGEVCMVTVEEIDGTFFFIPLLVYVFAPDHTLTFTADAPSPAYGINVGMRAYKISPTGPVIFSDLAFLDV